MPWAKLDDALFSNPKIIRAAPLARSLYVAGLCHCASGLTDGIIDRSAVPLLLAQTGAPRTAVRSLLDVGLWIDHGDTYEVKDYLQYNPPRSRTEAEREAARKRKERQRAKGRAAVDQDDAGQFTSRRDTGRDDQRDTSRDGRRESQGESPATRPVPSRGTSSSVTESRVEPDVAGAGAPTEEDRTPTTPEARAAAAITHMARCDLRAEQAKGTLIKHPDAWTRKAEATRRTSCWDQVLAAATERPTADPVTLAEDIDPSCGPDDGGLARSRARAAETDQAVADAAARRAERDRADAILEQLTDEQRNQLEAQVDPDAHHAVRLNALRALALEHHPDLAGDEAPAK